MLSKPQNIFVTSGEFTEVAQFFMQYYSLFAIFYFTEDLSTHKNKNKILKWNWKLGQSFEENHGNLGDLNFNQRI